MDSLKSKKNKMENLELKNTISKNYELDSKIEMIERKVRELEDRSIEVIQSEEQKKCLKKMNITSGTCGITAVCMIGVSESKDKEAGAEKNI